MRIISGIPLTNPFPYVINFGYVVKDTESCYTFHIAQYGSLKIDLKLCANNKNNFSDDGFELSINKLPSPVEINWEVIVFFRPNGDKYKEMDCNVKQSLNIFVSFYIS